MRKKIKYSRTACYARCMTSIHYRFGSRLQRIEYETVFHVNCLSRLGRLESFTGGRKLTLGHSLSLMNVSILRSASLLLLFVSELVARTQLPISRREVLITAQPAAKVLRSKARKKKLAVSPLSFSSHVTVAHV